MFEVHKGTTKPTKRERKQRGRYKIVMSKLIYGTDHVYSYKLHLNYAVMVLGLTPIFLQETLGIICFVSTRSLCLIV